MFTRLFSVWEDRLYQLTSHHTRLPVPHCRYSPGQQVWDCTLFLFKTREKRDKLELILPWGHSVCAASGSCLALFPSSSFLPSLSLLPPLFHPLLLLLLFCFHLLSVWAFLTFPAHALAHLEVGKKSGDTLLFIRGIGHVELSKYEFFSWLSFALFLQSNSGNWQGFIFRLLDRETNSRFSR